MRACFGVIMEKEMKRQKKSHRKRKGGEEEKGSAAHYTRAVAEGAVAAGDTLCRELDFYPQVLCRY